LRPIWDSKKERQRQRQIFALRGITKTTTMTTHLQKELKVLLTLKSARSTFPAFLDSFQ
jgi:hypothetical protein